MKFSIACVVLFTSVICSRAQEAAEDAPAPYQYKYDVNAQDPKGNQLYHGKEEAGDQAGKVVGSYYVLLPDKRLMRVAYEVDGDSGFKPTITFEDGANVPPPPPPEA